MVHGDRFKCSLLEPSWPAGLSSKAPRACPSLTQAQKRVMCLHSQAESETTFQTQGFVFPI